MRDLRGRFIKGHAKSNSGKTHFKKGFTPHNKEKEGPGGIDNPNYKHGLYKDKNFINKQRTERRHKLGISKIYRAPKEQREQNAKFQRKRHKALNKYPGELSIKTLQMVYEENIKKYGTLTCYLCLRPITFNNDSLDHKIPATRGGTNDYENLGIAHFICNAKKGVLTVEEYRKAVC